MPLDMDSRLATARTAWGEELVWFLQIAPPISALVMIWSPIATMMKIYSARHTASYPLMPYSMMLANSAVQLMYGWLLGDASIMFTHTVGLVSAVVYCGVWWRYRSVDAGTRVPVGTGVVVVMVAALLCAFLSREMAVKTVGPFGACVIVGVFAGPLYSLRHVFATRDASSIAWPFAIAGTVCSALWLLYGLLVLREPAVWFPNTVGLVPNCLQIFLLCYFGAGSGVSPSSPALTPTRGSPAKKRSLSRPSPL